MTKHKLHITMNENMNYYYGNSHLISELITEV